MVVRGRVACCHWVVVRVGSGSRCLLLSPHALLHSLATLGYLPFDDFYLPGAVLAAAVVVVVVLEVLRTRRQVASSCAQQHSSSHYTSKFESSATVVVLLASLV